MKKLLLVLGFVFSSGLLFAIDPAPPHIKAYIVNKSGVKIDSLFMSSNSDFNHPWNKYEDGLSCSIVSKDTVYCNNINHVFKIKVRFSDSTEIYSKTIYESQNYSTYDVVVEKNQITVNKRYDNLINYSVNFFCYFIFISFFFKVLIYLFKFKIKNKFTYSIKYTFINLLNISIIYFAAEILNLGVTIIFAFAYGLIVPYYADSILHRRDNNIIEYKNTTLRIVNVIFYIFGVIGLIIIWHLLKNLFIID